MKHALYPRNIVCFRYIIVNNPHKCDNTYYNYNNDNNNNRHI